MNYAELEATYSSIDLAKFAPESLDFIESAYSTLFSTNTSAIGRLASEGSKESIAQLAEKTGAQLNFIAGDIFTLRAIIGQIMALTGRGD